MSIAELPSPPPRPRFGTSTGGSSSVAKIDTWRRRTGVGAAPTDDTLLPMFPDLLRENGEEWLLLSLSELSSVPSEPTSSPAPSILRERLRGFSSSSTRPGAPVFSRLSALNPDNPRGFTFDSARMTPLRLRPKRKEDCLLASSRCLRICSRFAWISWPRWACTDLRVSFSPLAAVASK